jgi:hypothetical protein
VHNLVRSSTTWGKSQGPEIRLRTSQTQYERLHEVQKQVHNSLKPMFDAVSPKVKGETTAA